jgi:transcriptional regulator with XRE-family HTH domain
LVVKQKKSLLRKLRRERDLTLDVVAVRTGINLSTLSRVERRVLSASPEVRKRLEKFFKRPADELLADAPEAA